MSGDKGHISKHPRLAVVRFAANGGQNGVCQTPNRGKAPQPRRILGDVLLLLLIALGHQRVLLGDVVQHRALARLLELARHDDFVEDVVRLVEVEDQVEFTHIAEVTVQALDEVVDDFQREELVVS
eukprot:CAMPEP_0170224152 /NCGR_PEP_ID=MMETSP0116_2-20130129/11777_1 /TAXON_ID=400756 /ORGANISM="Durinskia baltica, Strain CSIRO CS-38" /LENGTH=125 /DNA_ID=CAMNT_0010474857 /DNA_START=143 /DNA_END=521 /DNA_ORIENTATION=-